MQPCKRVFIPLFLFVFSLLSNCKSPPVQAFAAEQNLPPIEKACLIVTSDNEQSPYGELMSIQLIEGLRRELRADISHCRSGSSPTAPSVLHVFYSVNEKSEFPVVGRTGYYVKGTYVRFSVQWKHASRRVLYVKDAAISRQKLDPSIKGVLVERADSVIVRIAQKISRLIGAAARPSDGLAGHWKSADPVELEQYDIEFSPIPDAYEGYIEGEDSAKKRIFSIPVGMSTNIESTFDGTWLNKAVRWTFREGVHVSEKEDLARFTVRGQLLIVEVNGPTYIVYFLVKEKE